MGGVGSDLICGVYTAL